MRLIQAFLVVTSFHALGAQLHSGALQNLGSSMQRGDSYGVQNDFSSHLFLPPSSPGCWLETLQELYPKDFGGNSNGQPALDLSTCAQLDTHHQQALGLRLTKCHLETMGRSLVETTDDGKGDDACEDLHHPNGVKKCLSNLSAYAGTTYTIFFKDLHYLCTRLLEESVTNRYHQTTQELEQASKLAKTQLQTLLRRQEESSLFWKEKEELWKEREDLWEEKKERMTQWFDEQSQLSANREQMQAKHEQDLHRHKEELQSLTDSLQSTKASVQPWAQLVDLVYQYVPVGYSILKVAASMFEATIIIIILTPHKELRRTRFKLFAAVLLGGLVEMILLWLENDDEIPLTSKERLQLSEGLRNFMMSFLFSCYLSGLLSFCCGWHRLPQVDDGDENDEDTFHDSVARLRREKELLERLRLLNNQQHWSATVANQRLQQQQHVQLEAALPNSIQQSRHPRPQFLIRPSPPPPQLIHSPEATVMASTPPYLAAPWNNPTSPWAPHHGAIPLYPNTAESGNFGTHDEWNDSDVESIDLPPEEIEEDEDQKTEETRDDSVLNGRKRGCSDIDEGKMAQQRDLPVHKKPRFGGQK